MNCYRLSFYAYDASPARLKASIIVRDAISTQRYAQLTLDRI